MTRSRLFLLKFTGRAILFYMVILLIASQIDLAFRLPRYITDFCQDYIAAQNLLKNESIYSRNECWGGTGVIKAYTTPHPPFSILIFVPFSYISLPQAMIAWLATSWFFYVLACAITLKIFNKLSPGLIIVVLFASIFYDPFRDSLSTQNIIHILLFLFCLTWYLQIKNKDKAAGFILGIAVLLRIWPALFALPAIFAKKTNYILFLTVSVLGGTLLTIIFNLGKEYFFYLGPVLNSTQVFIMSSSNSSLISIIAKVFYNLNFSRDEALFYSRMTGYALFFALLILIHGIALGKLARKKVFMLTQSLCLSMLIFIFPLVWNWALLIYAFCYAINLYILKGIRGLPNKWRGFFISSMIFLFMLKMYVPELPPSDPRLTSELNPGFIDIHNLLSVAGAILFFISQLYLLKIIVDRETG